MFCKDLSGEIMEVPIVEINTDDEWDDVYYVVSKLFDNDYDKRLYIDRLMKTPKPYAVASILKELIHKNEDGYGGRDIHYLARMTRDLKKLKSPILLYIPTDEYFKFKSNMHWTDITVWDVECEYLMLLMCRGEKSDFAPSDKFTVREVITMLNALLDVDVIYNFKQVDVFDEDTDWEDIFKPTKRIRVQKL